MVWYCMMKLKRNYKKINIQSWKWLSMIIEYLKRKTESKKILISYLYIKGNKGPITVYFSFSGVCGITQSYILHWDAGS